MRSLNLPTFSYRTKLIDNKIYIFDILRKKFVFLTPEEWVRQHFVHFLISVKSFPAGRIGNEVTVILNGMRKRSDTVIYNQEGEPLVVVEYKAPSEKIDQKVFDQITRYNMVLKVPYLIVSNGINHYCCVINYTDLSYRFLSEIPHFDQL